MRLSAFPGTAADPSPEVEEEAGLRREIEAPRAQAIACTVSIVVAAYNCERHLPQTIESIRTQTFRDWECVIVDDGSTDGTLAVADRAAAEDARFRTVTRLNGGPSAARNWGLDHISRGSQYLIFMDSDDLWVPEALEVLIAEAELHPEAVGVHAVGRCIDGEGMPHDDPAYSGAGRYVCNAFGRHVPLPRSEPTTFASLWFSNPFPPGLVLGRRWAYDRIGFFDTAGCPEDWDMLIRLSRHGDLRYVERVLLSYRRHSGNLSATCASLNVHKQRYLAHKTFFSSENDAGQHRIVRRNWRATQLSYLWLNLAAAGTSCGRAEFGKAASALARAGVCVIRYARGYPALRGI